MLFNSDHCFEFEIPQYVKNIIRDLEVHGHHGCMVGGAVCDSITGRAPDDFDIVTLAEGHDLSSTRMASQEVIQKLHIFSLVRG